MQTLSLTGRGRDGAIPRSVSRSLAASLGVVGFRLRGTIEEVMEEFR